MKKPLIFIVFSIFLMFSAVYAVPCTVELQGKTGTCIDKTYQTWSGRAVYYGCHFDPYYDWGDPWYYYETCYATVSSLSTFSDGGQYIAEVWSANQNQLVECADYDGYACDVFVSDGVSDINRPDRGFCDASEKNCVKCNNEIESKSWTGGPSITGTGDGLCESGCGADYYCDEKNIGDYIGRCINKFEAYCNNNCQQTPGTCEYDCGAQKECDELNPDSVCANDYCLSGRLYSYNTDYTLSASRCSLSCECDTIIDTSLCDANDCNSAGQCNNLPAMTCPDSQHYCSSTCGYYDRDLYYYACIGESSYRNITVRSDGIRFIGSDYEEYEMNIQEVTGDLDGDNVTIVIFVQDSPIMLECDVESGVYFTLVNGTTISTSNNELMIFDPINSTEKPIKAVYSVNYPASCNGKIILDPVSLNSYSSDLNDPIGSNLTYTNGTLIFTESGGSTIKVSLDPLTYEIIQVLSSDQGVLSLNNRYSTTSRTNIFYGNHALDIIPSSKALLSCIDTSPDDDGISYGLNLFAGSGTASSGQCCGDDPNEFFYVQFESQACCDQETDCVYDNDCYDSNTGFDDYWCYNHEWDDCNSTDTDLVHGMMFCDSSQVEWKDTVYCDGIIDFTDEQGVCEADYCNASIQCDEKEPWTEVINGNDAGQYFCYSNKTMKALCNNCLYDPADSDVGTCESGCGADLECDEQLRGYHEDNAGCNNSCDWINCQHYEWNESANTCHTKCFDSSYCFGSAVCSDFTADCLIDSEPPIVLLNITSGRNSTALNGWVHNNTPLSIDYLTFDSVESMMNCEFFIDGGANPISLGNASYDTWYDHDINDLNWGVLEHTIQVNCSDEAGNEGSSIVRTYYLDSEPPEYSDISYYDITPTVDDSLIDGDLVNVSVLWNDNLMLDKAFIETNATFTSGEKLIILDDYPGTESVSHALIDTLGMGGETVYWRAWAVDFAGNAHSIPAQYFFVNSPSTEIGVQIFEGANGNYTDTFEFICNGKGCNNIPAVDSITTPGRGDFHITHTGIGTTVRIGFKLDQPLDPGLSVIINNNDDPQGGLTLNTVASFPAWCNSLIPGEVCKIWVWVSGSGDSYYGDYADNIIILSEQV